MFFLTVVILTKEESLEISHFISLRSTRGLVRLAKQMTINTSSKTHQGLLLINPCPQYGPYGRQDT